MRSGTLAIGCAAGVGFEQRDAFVLLSLKIEVPAEFPRQEDSFDVGLVGIADHRCLVGGHS